jgi:hypothetical protein
MKKFGFLSLTIGLLVFIGFLDSCTSKTTAIQSKHIVQLKQLYLLIFKYSESHEGKSPESLTELMRLVDEDGVIRLLYCSDVHGVRREWIYFGATRLNESPPKILIEGPIRYNSGKKVYLDTAGHAFLK